MMRRARPTNPQPAWIQRLPHRLQLPAEVLWLSGVDFRHDRGFQWAAAAAYYGLLSTLPLLLSAVSLAAHFVDPYLAAADLTHFLGQFIPQGERQIRELVFSVIRERESIGVYSTLFLLWSGSRVFSVITAMLNIAFDADEDYSLVKSTLVELAMVLSLGLMYVTALILQFAIHTFNTVLEQVWVTGDWLPWLLAKSVPSLFSFSAYYLIYQYVPRRRVKRRAAAGGAILATVMFMVAQPLFLRYVNNFAHYNLVYGSLAIVIALVFWSWLAAVILLFGGELAAHIQTLVLEDKSPEAVEQQHIERSPKSGGEQ